MEFKLDEWPVDCGAIKHKSKTRERVMALLQSLHDRGLCDYTNGLVLLRSADVICNMAMWLTVHMTYAERVRLDGGELSRDDFKSSPQGHTGGALNMVPAYVGYMLANLLTGKTRAWLMGQGHCVAAIDSVNVLLGNLEQEQAHRYPLSESGLSRLCQDYYSYQHDAHGYPVAPLGSHVNAHTAGGILEGGYLGFAGLQYPHMPLPGQELVAFLSDGAFEEQRGSDWATRWWRGEDTGLVMPIMIANGRRIEQRTSSAQKGGSKWLAKHLRLNGFDPVEIDGRDPAAFAWAIITMSEKLAESYKSVAEGTSAYPIEMPYAIAETEKGYGFPGAGTNAAHNLPLALNPHEFTRGAESFNKGARVLFQSMIDLDIALDRFKLHTTQGRVREREHPLCVFDTPNIDIVGGGYTEVGDEVSPMRQLDKWFVTFIKANDRIRFRVANPDELASNRFTQTLTYLKHRVNKPEADSSEESVMGGIITALNEEAVVSAAFANKQGVNLVVSYEAFAVKMLGAMRQEVIFARNLLRAHRAVNWVSVPVIASSHTWENGKNEISHQDPALSEVWIQEMHDVAPVFFPFDGNSALAIVQSLYQQTGRVATVVTPKGEIENCCTETEAQKIAVDGAFVIKRNDNAIVQLVTVGAYQLLAARLAAKVLDDLGIEYSLVAITEPARFREPRDAIEGKYTHSDSHIEKIIPDCAKRVFITHTRADVMVGVLRKLDTGRNSSLFMGYENRGGTLDVAGMQLLNRQSPENIVKSVLNLVED